MSLEDSDQIAVFDLGRALRQGSGRSDLIGTIPLGVAPVGMAISPGGRYLFATSESSKVGQQEGTLSTIDVHRAERTPAQSVISTVAAGCSPVRVVATKSAVFVTARKSDALLGFSAPDLVSDPSAALLADVQIGQAPVAFTLLDHDHLVMVADSDLFAAAGAHPD